MKRFIYNGNVYTAKTSLDAWDEGIRTKTKLDIRRIERERLGLIDTIKRYVARLEKVLVDGSRDSGGNLYKAGIGHLYGIEELLWALAELQAQIVKHYEAIARTETDSEFLTRDTITDEDWQRNKTRQLGKP